ncbi:MAG: AI-2E family transporter [Betaproteobacteria bacterium]|nr:AI-2E family transporter [Betaproteobacteria bacterium]
MTFLRPIHLQTAAWTGVALALATLLWLLSPILMPFALGAIFAYLCNPIVNALVRRRLPRTAAALLVVIGLILSLAALLLVFLPMVYKQAVIFAQRLPGLIDLFNVHVSPALNEHLDVQLQLDAAQIRVWLGQFFANSHDLIPAMLQRVGHRGMEVAMMLVNLLMVPFVAFYLLQEWPRIIDGLSRMLPRPWLPRARRIANEIDSVLAQFFRGQMLVMLILAVYYSVGLSLIGLDFALPVGVLTGMLIFIPYIGFGSGMVLAVLTALLQGGWEPLIGVAIVYGIGQVVESFALTPYIVGERIGLHPLAVIFALLAFGQLFGFTGVLIALPASAALLVGLREVASAWFASPVYQGDEGGTDPPAAPARRRNRERGAK